MMLLLKRTRCKTLSGTFGKALARSSSTRSSAAAALENEILERLDQVRLQHRAPDLRTMAKVKPVVDAASPPQESLSATDIELRRFANQIKAGATPEDVLAALEELKVHPRLRPNVYHYSAACTRLKQLHRPREMLEVFNIMRNDPEILSMSAPVTGAESTDPTAASPEEQARRLLVRGLYSVALNTYNHEHMWKHAFEVIRNEILLERDGQDTSRIELLTLSPPALHAPVSSRKVLEEMHARAAAGATWLAPDPGNHTAALSACSRSGAWEAALGLLGLMKARKEPVHAFSYNAVLGARTLTRPLPLSLSLSLVSTLFPLVIMVSFSLSIALHRSRYATVLFLISFSRGSYSNNK